jgi:hypothetical protein
MKFPIPAHLEKEWPQIDPECRNLVAALNALPGIRTTGSCCGHGKGPFSVEFQVDPDDTLGLSIIARATCPRYNSYGENELMLYPLWRVQLYHDDVNLISYEVRSVEITPENEAHFKYHRAEGLDPLLFPPAEKLAHTLLEVLHSDYPRFHYECHPQRKKWVNFPWTSHT